MYLFQPLLPDPHSNMNMTYDHCRLLREKHNDKVSVLNLNKFVPILAHGVCVLSGFHGGVECIFPDIRGDLTVALMVKFRFPGHLWPKQKSISIISFNTIREIDANKRCSNFN